MSTIATSDSAASLGERVRSIGPFPRIERLKEAMLDEPRSFSVEQARIITRSYRRTLGLPRVERRAHALADALREIAIRIDPDELVVGNRTAGVRGGVVSPEAGIGWVADELDTLPTRPQDPFDVREEDARAFREEILPVWRGHTLEDEVARRLGEEIAAVKSVVKINQTDHAQGHIAPDVARWLELGPMGLRERARAKLAAVTGANREKGAGAVTEGATLAGSAGPLADGATQLEAAGAVAEGATLAGSAGPLADGATQPEAAGALTAGAPSPAAGLPGDTSAPAGAPFYRAAIITLDGAIEFMRRYAAQAERLAEATDDAARKATFREVASVCAALAERPPATFHEALQSLWFLFVMLQMESNASSFSPGRMDQYLLPYLEADLAAGRLTLERAQELLEALWLKFNQIVYMRNAGSAQYFAGFPIGFNVAIGGTTRNGQDATNQLSFMMLLAQEHIGLPQPNLSARLHEGSPNTFVDTCARVIGLGSGMPQVVNDESVIPALASRGITVEDARDYAVVGCVELSTQGNNLGWSDAAMFNLVKVVELALNDGVCMLTGRQLGPRTGLLTDFDTFDRFLAACRAQLDHFVDRMIPLCDAVDRMHAEMLPSPFLSSVIDGCIESGVDVTAGGAKYNLSGIQAIQPANVADSLAAVKQLVFDQQSVDAAELLAALRSDFAGSEELRHQLIHEVPKYGNDVAWVDEFGAEWARSFAERLGEFTNARGGPYHMGLYTVSAHVPMGKNVAATPDGRHARDPLADGGMSAMYGRDVAGPTALLKSVSRVESKYASNGTLLNMKFLPRTFDDPHERAKFVALLRAVVRLRIHHAQFNVVNRETLEAAQADPDRYRNLTIRVAGYTAYFVELAPDLQDEIIARTSYGGGE